MPTNRKTKAEVATPSMKTGRETDRITIKARVESVDWPKVRADLDTQGWAVVPQLLTHVEADSIANLYPLEQGFRSHVVMARHGFGRRYKYFVTRCHR